MKSSEEINEEIEGLASCIASNTGALEKSLVDLSTMRKSCTDKEVEDGANKILSQFEQFNEYIKQQLNGIKNGIFIRSKKCETDLKKLVTELFP